tara:strand:- start:17415 stop:17759 length:345 start_codon:yes stop_codon:yes gene_type:complete
MRKKKQLKFDNWNIYVMYNDSDTEMDLINDANSQDLICFTFVPKELVTERKAQEIMGTYENEMISEAKKIVEANKSFYKNFDIEYKFGSHGFIMKAQNKSFVARMEKRLKIKPK